MCARRADSLLHVFSLFALLRVRCPQSRRARTREEEQEEQEEQEEVNPCNSEEGVARMLWRVAATVARRVLHLRFCALWRRLGEIGWREGDLAEGVDHAERGEGIESCAWCDCSSVRPRAAVKIFSPETK